MAQFVIIPTLSDSSALDGAIAAAEFGNKALKLPRGEWLVAYEGTSKQLSDHLNISEGQNGAAVVLNFSGYYGRADKGIWEWISVNAAP